MNDRGIAKALEALASRDVAVDLTERFRNLRQDMSVGLLERTTAGKFVEVLVEFLEEATGQKRRKGQGVDAYLGSTVPNLQQLPDGVRICGSRIARSIYTIRNKRNVAHKNEVSPNKIDLAYTYHAASWIMAEFVRCASNVSMEEAHRLIGLITTPVGVLVEELDGEPLVLRVGLPLRKELLVLLYWKDPDPVVLAELARWCGKRPPLASARLSELRNLRQVRGDAKGGFVLTALGRVEALDIVAAEQNT